MFILVPVAISLQQSIGWFINTFFFAQGIFLLLRFISLLRKWTLRLFLRTSFLREQCAEIFEKSAI
jgi:hypothetical protein